MNRNGCKESRPKTQQRLLEQCLQISYEGQASLAEQPVGVDAVELVKPELEEEEKWQ